MTKNFYDFFNQNLIVKIGICENLIEKHKRENLTEILSPFQVLFPDTLTLYTNIKVNLIQL